MEVRDVDEDVARPEIVRHPAPTLEVERDLRDAIVDRYVHRRERRRIRDAYRGKGVQRLECAHGFFVIARV